MITNRLKQLSAIIAFCAMLAGCATDDTQKAQQLLEDIHTEYRNGQYQHTLSLIDSLRRTYPKAVEQRKEALKIYQEAVLAMAQTDLMRLDTALQSARQQYEDMRTQAERHHSEGTATAEELTAVTLQRIRRDSLQARFDAQVARVRFIHKKQKEQ